MYNVLFSPDGKYIVTAANNKIIQFWDVASHEYVRAFNQPDDVKSVSYSPDGRFIWSGSLDGKIRQWDAVSGQLVRVFSGPRGYSFVDDISPDGKLVLVEYDDQTVHLFDIDYHDTIRYACSRLVRDLTITEEIAFNITGAAAPAVCPKP
jgi:WD40 repeat protein